MAIDSVSNITQLIEALRQRISATNVNAPISVALNATQTAGAAIHAKKEKRDIQSLERKLHARIGKLQKAGEDTFKQSARVFIEGVLSWEFGESLVQDPRFHQMLDDIVETVTRDEELAAQFRTLFAKMKG